jgi:hypothetical protein
VRKVEAFIGERARAVDAGRPGPVAVEEVAALDHEGFYDAVEEGAFVADRLIEVGAGGANAVGMEVSVDVSCLAEGVCGGLREEEDWNMWERKKFKEFDVTETAVSPVLKSTVRCVIDN